MVHGLQGQKGEPGDGMGDTAANMRTPGPKGSKGDPGIGPPGPTGDPGIGTAGIIGPPGVAGKGIRGFPGRKGERGRGAGYPGVKGVKGERGNGSPVDSGQPGKQGRLSVVNVMLSMYVIRMTQELISSYFYYLSPIGRSGTAHMRTQYYTRWRSYKSASMP